MLFDLYRSCAQVSCFEGEGAGAGAAGEGAGAGAAGDGANATYTQEEFNKALAEDRRKHQAQLKVMETRLQDSLKSNTLNEGDRKSLQENLSAVQGQLRSKEQQAALEKQELEASYQVKLSAMEETARKWELLHRDSTVQRSLQDAAIKHDAFSASQVVTLLKPMTKMIEEMDPVTKRSNGFKVVVEMPGTDPKTGEFTLYVHTPDEAVKRMKELPEYGNQFKSGVVSGIGAGSATGGLAPGQNGKVDVAKLTPQQYREIRATNPERLGLRPLKANRS
jgi:hypothetical protein